MIERSMRSVVLFSTVALTLLLVTTTKADIAPEPPAGRAFLSHYLKMENLADYPGFALLVYDPSPDGKITASRTFKVGKDAEQLLENQSNWRSARNFDRPGIWLLSLAQEKAWSKKTGELIAQQREACARRGEGCAHISRFVPKYPPPAEAIDCGVRIDIQTTVAKGQNDRVVDVYRIAKATDKTCQLEHATGPSSSKVASNANSSPSNPLSPSNQSSNTQQAENMKVRPTKASGCTCSIPRSPSSHPLSIIIVIAAFSLCWIRPHRTRR